MRLREGRRIARPSVISLLLFDLAFLVAYCFGRASTQNLAAPFWFPDAALLCGLLLSRPNVWWLYILATAPIRFLLCVPPATPLWFLFAGFVSDSLKGLLSAWLLRRSSQDRAWFDNLHEFGRYFLVAVVLGPGLSAFASAASSSVLGNPARTRSFPLAISRRQSAFHATFSLLYLRSIHVPVRDHRSAKQDVKRK